jgi:DNA-directed RNA polymerase subunit RPC12/RpoP
MKFLCLDCDEPMKLLTTAGPDEGSLTATFRCPECGFRVAMLTNPYETQMVRSLGVKLGGRSEPATPFEHLRSSMASSRADAFAGSDAPSPEVVDRDEGTGPGCPFAAIIGEGSSSGRPAGSSSGRPAGSSESSSAPPAEHAEPPRGPVVWDPAAEARVVRIPFFIRPMARRAIERYAEGKGYRVITETVMDEARGAMGM